MSNKERLTQNNGKLGELIELLKTKDAKELVASSDEEMQQLLIEANISKVVKFTGTSDIYETDTYYLIGE